MSLCLLKLELHVHHNSTLFPDTKVSNTGITFPASVGVKIPLDTLFNVLSTFVPLYLTL